MKKYFLILLILNGCIGEDIIFDEVTPEIRITNPVESLEVGTDYQFEYMMTNSIGQEVAPETITWTSSNESFLTINETGLASAIADGSVTITILASLGEIDVETDLTFEVSDETVTMPTRRVGTVATTSSYKLKGSFELTKDGDDLILSLASNYEADTALPGLYVYLSNNPNSSANAREIAAVTVFNGAHSYRITNVGLYDYQYVLYFCKPFNVKVGHGQIMNP